MIEKNTPSAKILSFEAAKAAKEAQLATAKRRHVSVTSLELKHPSIPTEDTVSAGGQLLKATFGIGARNEVFNKAQETVGETVGDQDSTISPVEAAQAAEVDKVIAVLHTTFGNTVHVNLLPTVSPEE
jgi:hypothetical protein